MHPPLLRATAGGRRKNRMKSALEGGSSQNRRKHECPICHEKGHHWYTCKNGNPEDIAAMEADRGLPKKRLKKSTCCNTETSIVVATPSVMQFPKNDAVEKAAANKRSRKASSSSVKKRKGSATSASTRSGTGSNDPIEAAPLDSMLSQAASPRRKIAVKKKLTPKRPPATIQASPTSPASNTRSKKKLELQ